MKRTDSNVPCPSCRGPLQPRVLVCDACDIRVEGRFQTNEFAALEPEDLHFLRIFVHCEGRIKDMEAALGLSYPTIRTRLGALKNKLTAVPVPPSSESVAAENVTRSREILESLEAGKISFEEAMKQLKETTP
jgi:hypothetical protein